MLHYNYKVFGLICMLIGSTINCNGESLKRKSWLNKWLSAFSSSKAAALFENKLFTKIYDPIIKRLYGDELAKQEYQDLGKEAQSNLGIPIEHHVPIKKVPKSASDMLAGAFTVTSAIYVNEDRVNARTYGVQRSLFFHEAVHKKYNDFSHFMLIDFAATVGFATLAHTLLMRFKNDLSRWAHYPIVLFSAGLGANIVLSFYKSYAECRADIEGHYATECWQCVQESANRRREMFELENHAMKNDGFLYANDLEKIAQDLKVQNKLCSFHNK